METTEHAGLLAGRYACGELLGRGGMAEVWDAVDERLGRPVAVKMLLPHLAVRPDLRARFEAEARSAARLSHPNAVGVFDVGEDAGRPFLVMERLPGETLADRMAEGPIDETWLRAVAIDVLGALGAAHAAGIVHRDVKPGNILISADDRAKIADFGIAKSVDGGVDTTATGQLLGTPAYLAPERLSGSPATACSDLYSLGVVLYEALAGEKPFTGSTPVLVAHAVSQGAHRPLAEVRPDADPGFAAAIERALRMDPDDRFASAEHMRDALAASATAGAGAADATAFVEPPPADATTVLAMPPSAAGERAPVAAGWSPTRRAVAIAVWLGVLVLLGLTAMGALAGSSRNGKPAVATPTNASPATTVTTPPTTAAPLVNVTLPKLPGKTKGGHGNGGGD
ncbi:MAG: Serine/threonine-protein kinase PrkC [Acidimicrobiales bacterium]|nr:Serine/threonine-protein kinase PrkC [Acidimicrobiales bacterium]